MANKAKFFVACFEDSEGRTCDVDFYSFMKKIEEQLEENKEYVYKNINGKIIRTFSYSKPDVTTEMRMSIPFGKLKKSINYTEDATGKKLTPENSIFYNINSLYYDKNENICLFTTSQYGPTIQAVQEYLQKYIPEDSGLKIVFHSILNRITLTDIHASQQVTSITIALKLNTEVEQLYRDNLNIDNDFFKCFLGVAHESKKAINGNSFVITIGMGRTKKESLTIDVVCDLINRLGINSDYINEVTVNYKNNTTERIEIGKLKSSLDLSVTFPTDVRELSTEYLLKYAGEYVNKNRNKIIQQRDNFFNNLVSADEFNLVKAIEVDLEKLTKE